MREKFVRQNITFHSSRKKLRETDRHDFGKNVRRFQAATQIRKDTSDKHHIDAM